MIAVCGMCRYLWTVVIGGINEMTGPIRRQSRRMFFD